VIDPAVIIYAGFIGGTKNDTALRLAVDNSGNAYVVGLTTSNTSEGFPATVGPDLSFNPNRGFSAASYDFLDVFIAKVKADGTGLIYCGYIGGDGGDTVYSVAVDGAGSTYVTGETSSSPASLPVMVGPSLNYGGSFDAFVAKVKADGTGLDYLGYIGGSGIDRGFAIAVDAQGSAYVTGETTSPATSLPVAVGPRLTFGGITDAFVAKVKPDGSGLVYLGYIGGADVDAGSGIAVDGAGNAYVTGGTGSPESSFPVAVGPKLSFSGSNNKMFGDAFIAKVKADGTG